MSSHVEKQLFSERLHQALAQSGLAGAGATVLARRFNLLYNGEPVTAQAVRKWLEGSAIPAQDKLMVLARWLKVSPHWLRFGEDADAAEMPAVRESPRNEYAATELADLVQLLDEDDRKTVGRIVRALLRDSGA